MTIPYIARLERGAKYLDLNTSRYKIRDDFVPPATAVTAYFAAGTSANVYAGASKAGQKASNIPWSFTIDCRGSSGGEVQRAIRDLTSFVSQSGESTPLYFAFRGIVTIAAEPTWGQHGANTRFEIVHAETPTVGTHYGKGPMREIALPVTFTVNIKPYGLGKRQRVASATGGILEDTLGSETGESSGLIVPEATTNLFTNPIFGHATFNNGWTNGSDVSDTEVTDPEYVLFGKSAALLVATGGTNLKFTQSLTAGNTNTHTLTAYVRLRDGSEPTSSDVIFTQGGIQAPTTFTQVKDSPWYRMESEFAATAGASDIGVELGGEGRHAIVDGFQYEQKTFSTPLCYGDMLGCSWAGTAHASTSTRVLGKVQVAGQHNLDGGAFMVAWEASILGSDYLANGTLLHDDSTDMLFQWEWSATRWAFTDGVNTITGAADSFNPGDVFVFHVVYGSGGLKIYKNGVSIASGNNYSPGGTVPKDHGNLVIGSTAAGTGRSRGTIRGLSIYPHEITAAEVLADYNNAVQVLNDNQSLAPIPWLWTKDGDGDIDTNTDSTHTHYAVCGGVSGDERAISEFRFAVTEGAGALTKIYLGLSHLAGYPVFTVLSDWFSDKGPTADANASGGTYDATITANTVHGSQSAGSVLDDAKVFGKTLHIFARLKSTLSYTYNIAPLFRTSSQADSVFPSQTKPLAITTAWKTFYAGKVVAANLAPFQQIAASEYGFVYGFAGYATAANALHVDYTAVVTGDLVELSGGGIENGREIILKGLEAFSSASGTMRESVIVKGTAIDAIPDGANMYSLHIEGADLLTQKITMSQIHITPRWRIF